MQPDPKPVARYRIRITRRLNNLLKNTGKSVILLLGASLLSNIFYGLGFTEPNLIMVYILGVVLTSVATTHVVYSLASSVASVCLFNYFFTPPRFSLTAYSPGSVVTFLIMFLTAFITGTLALRYKERAAQTAEAALRTRILLDTDQKLAKAGSRSAILDVAREQLNRLLKRDIQIFQPTDDTPRQLRRYTSLPVSHDAEAPGELEAARWALDHNCSAGATTDTHGQAQYLYLPLRVGDRLYGVAGVLVGKDPPEEAEYDIMLSILGECALALENESNARAKEAAAVLAENERLRANLLRSISHDLRTPLTAISGHASNLLSDSARFDDDTRRQLYQDIYNDAEWLIRLVENLLHSTRIENGRMNLHPTPELLSDIVDAVLQNCIRRARGRTIRADHEDELLLVRADTKLMIQVLLNLLDNAFKYTPEGSPITITTRRLDRYAEVSVADLGPGIPDTDKAKIFDMFYCGAAKSADSHRSLGLGLYLCRVIVEAHGGVITVEDNLPRGTVFRFTLPIEEVALHESTIPDSGHGG